MKMKYHKEWRSGSLVQDLKRRFLLCQMIAVGRERRLLELKMAGYPVGDNPEQWQTSVDPRCGSKYSFILCGAPWWHSSNKCRRLFAVEHATGAIFAVYEGSHSSRVNRERRYGTLDTLEDWDWAYTEPRLRILFRE